MSRDTVRLALAGDTMLGRGVAEAIVRAQGPVLDPEVVALAAGADAFLLNLECCISERGEPWPAPGKPFFFRAPPRAAELLASWGVDCVSLANNHALDYGAVALLDTFEHLRGAGVAWVGAGPDLEAARAPGRLRIGRTDVVIAAATDHPEDFAAAADRPGVAYADLRAGVPRWLDDTVAAMPPDAVRLCLVHWGPNMTPAPLRYVRRAAARIRAAGATLVAGTSAHVPHGAADGVVFDLGDFVDDYAVHPELRNDLGMLFLVTLSVDGPAEAEAIPLVLDYCHTRLAAGADAEFVNERFARACVDLGGAAEVVDGHVRFALA